MHRRTGHRAFLASLIAFAAAICWASCASGPAHAYDRPMTQPDGLVHCKDESHLHVLVGAQYKPLDRPVTVTWQLAMPCKNEHGGTPPGVVLSVAKDKPLDGLHVLASALGWLVGELRAAATAPEGDGVAIAHPDHGDFLIFTTVTPAEAGQLADAIMAAALHDPIDPAVTP